MQMNENNSPFFQKKDIYELFVKDFCLILRPDPIAPRRSYVLAKSKENCREVKDGALNGSHCVQNVNRPVLHLHAAHKQDQSRQENSAKNFCISIMLQ